MEENAVQRNARRVMIESAPAQKAHLKEHNQQEGRVELWSALGATSTPRTSSDHPLFTFSQSAWVLTFAGVSEGAQDTGSLFPS